MVSIATDSEKFSVGAAVPDSEISKKAATADRVAALLESPAEMRFKDFEDPNYPVDWALQDYCNVFAPLTLATWGFGIELSMSLLKNVKELWVPWVAEYFCTKALSGGISMDKTGIAIWKALSVTEKTRFTSIFHERHLSGFDWRKMGIIDLVERDAYLLDRLLNGEWPDESDKKACRHFVEILGSVATRATWRMRTLGDVEAMETEIADSSKE